MRHGSKQITEKLNKFTKQYTLKKYLTRDKTLIFIIKKDNRKKSNRQKLNSQNEQWTVKVNFKTMEQYWINVFLGIINKSVKVIFPVFPFVVVAWMHSNIELTMSLQHFKIHKAKQTPNQYIFKDAKWFFLEKKRKHIYIYIA